MLEEHFSATLDEACKEMRLSCSRRRNIRGGECRTLKALRLCLVILLDCFPPLQKYLPQEVPGTGTCSDSVSDIIRAEVKHERTSI